jgi:hypothetical protein
VTNTTGNENSAIGYKALYSNINGEQNTAIGVNALLSNTEGSLNVGVGNGALSNNTAGIGNIAIGINAGLNVTTADDVICIGSNVDGANENNGCYIGQIFGVTSSGGTAVFINSDGKLGTTTSSRRFKEEIKPISRTSEALFALKPVTFRYKKEIDPAGRSQFGLVAEEVAEVNPDLVVRDKEGKAYSVRYDAVNAMLLNEFLKEHKKVEEQQATIVELKSTVAQQRKDFETATTQQQRSFQSMFAEQERQIQALASGLQKVSAQLELTRPVAQTAFNHP